MNYRYIFYSNGLVVDLSKIKEKRNPFILILNINIFSPYS